MDQILDIAIALKKSVATKENEKAERKRLSHTEINFIMKLTVFTDATIQ